MNLKTTLGERIGTGPEWHVHLAFRIGQACALVRNGNSVSEGRKEAKGCVDANKRIYAGLIVRLWDACLASTQWRFLPLYPSGSFWGFKTPNGVASIGARVVLPAGKVEKLPRMRFTLNPTRKRHIHPIKATVMTETPSGVNENI